MKIHRSLGVVAAGLALSLAATVASADQMFAVGPQDGTPYTNLYEVDTDGHIGSTGALVRPLGGGFAPLTTPISGLAVGNGNLFAVGPQDGTPYTNLYAFDTDGHILSTGALVRPLGGGFAPLTTPISSIAFGNGELFGVGPQDGTPYTNLYAFDTDGHILSTGALVSPLGGGFAPLTTPITAITYFNGDLFGVGPQDGTSYTNLYEFDTDGHILSTGALVRPLGGGFAPLTTPVTGLTFDNGDLFAVGPQDGTPYTNLYGLDFDGHIFSTGAFVRPLAGGFAPLTTPIAAIAFEETTPGGVPEPAAWGLMLMGFASLGAALRARRARASVAGEGHATA